MAKYLSEQDALKQRVARWAIKLRVNPRLVRVQRMTCKWGSCSRLRTHNQNMTVAAIAMALMNAWAQRSYRVATRRQSLSLPNMRSIRLRCL